MRETGFYMSSLKAEEDIMKKKEGLLVWISIGLLSKTAFWNINTEWVLPLMRIIILLFLQSAFRLSMGPRSLTWINFS